MRTLIQLLLLFPSISFAAPNITCDYNMMGAPFARVELSRYPDGSLAPVAEVTPTGSPQPRRENFAAQTPNSDEIIHGWISKDSKENSLELIIFSTNMEKGNSVLINPHVPFGREAWGTCQGAL